jgi:hypothetical protein
MTSPRKIAANRLNALKSSGPRRAASKARVSNNAYRHGLAALKHVEAGLPRDIELMARALCGDDMNPLLFEQARVIAASQLLLQCVTAERIAAIERLRDLKAVPLAARVGCIKRAKARGREFERAFAELEQMRAKFDALSEEERARLFDEDEKEEDRLASKPARIEERDEVEAMREAVPDLERLTRYERRAWSRGRRALRQFMDIRPMTSDS